MPDPTLSLRLITSGALDPVIRRAVELALKLHLDEPEVRKAAEIERTFKRVFVNALRRRARAVRGFEKLELDTAHENQVDLFRRRLNKLRSSVAEMEVEIVSLRRIKDADPGIASIYSCVQGLDPYDRDYEAKTEMLAAVFEANYELQKGTRVA